MSDGEMPDEHMALFWRPRIWIRKGKRLPTRASSEPLSIFIFSSYEEAVKHAREKLGRAHLEEAIIVPTEAIKELSNNWLWWVSKGGAS